MVFGNKTKSLILSFLFIVSSAGASVLIAPVTASPNSPAALAAAPLSTIEANWAWPNGNQFAYDYNPQNQINSSNVQDLALSWLFPLPTHPAPLLSIPGGLGVDTAPLIVNGTIYALTQYGQVFALNAANGNVLWTDTLPLTVNSTQGLGIGPLGLHLHDGNEQFTTKLFNHTPTFWVASPDLKDYAINALNGKYELNFSVFTGPKTIDGNSPAAIYSGLSNLLVDENKGILISSIESGVSSITGRCFFRGWNILVTPPQLMWTSFCTPPQPGGNLPVDPSWEINQVNAMKGAEIFYPGPQYNNGGSIPGSAAVDLKKLSASQLNATLYDDWGYVNKSPFCAGLYSGSTGSTAAGWGASWVLGSGPTSGLAFVPTNNKDPYESPCTPGPNLWSAAILALNETNGNWVWGFQAIAHDLWDYDCSWWQALGNETINGVNTPVVWKTCKAGYLFELNALNGNMIWAWTPPLSIEQRCQDCYMLNPLNRTQMTQAFFNPTLKAEICTPCSFSFESESAYSPATNYLYVVSQNQPRLIYYVAPNSTNFRTNSGWAPVPIPGQTSVQGPYDNATVEAVNAATGQTVWTYYVANQGYRGGLSTSGNVVYVTLSSGDLVMLNAQTGKVIKDLFIGGPLNVLPSIGATSSGQMEVIVPITAGIITWGTGVPGDIVALSLRAPSGGTTSTGGATVSSAATVTVTSTTTVGAGATATVTSGGIDPTLTYGIAAVAVIFIIATGFLAMRSRRKPAP